MDADRLTALLRSRGIGATRRDLTRALSGISLAAPLATFFGVRDVEAKKKHKKKNR